MGRIPDLHYKVIRVHSMFVRAKHLTVFYRHDKNGRPFIYHVATSLGQDGRKTRSQAARYGRDVVERRAHLPYRETYITADDRAAVRATGLDPEYTGG